ncbi:hypothetical protein [Aquimarina litoralis]|uniref:hypothetical protein n=1 Tax=Aquimarina litoralis TaxID=584605 RepID=UPI001C585FBB|nr:hypothetical protein [Aquimarina litoralis]MBW1296110.1 hypothetical protein [Aquimarina litoralis]
MKKIIPFENYEEAINELDNGGRFYNILTKAEDGVISPAELGKVAGLFSDKQKMILFLDIATSKLNNTHKNLIISSLSNDLQLVYNSYKAKEIVPSEGIEMTDVSSNVIVTGVPKKIASKSNFNGFIMVPIVAGKVTTFSMIPIVETYNVYEVTDIESSSSYIIAHSKEFKKFPETKMKIAGAVKELSDKKDKTGATKLYVEALYYLEI